MRRLLRRLLGRPDADAGSSQRPRRPSAVYLFECRDGRALPGSLRRVSPPGNFGQAAITRCGRRLAYWGTATGNEEAAPPRVWVTSLEGVLPAACVTSGPGLQGHPAWHPDGRQLLYFESEAADWDPRRQFEVGRPPAHLTWLDTATGETRPLTAGPYTDERPAVSPNGASVVFVSNRSGQMNLWQVAADGSRLTRLTDGPGPDYRPAFSPDGGRIAWFRPSPDGRHQICVRDLASGADLPCDWTRRFEWSHGPWWFSDGTALLLHALARRAQIPGLWRVELASGDVRPLDTPGLAGASHGVLDAAERWLVCDSRKEPSRI